MAVFLFLFLLVGPVGVHCVNTVSVAPGGAGIKAAVLAVSPGDTILLSSGVYEGSPNCDILLSKSLTIIGDGPLTTIINCTGVQTRCLSIADAERIAISGVTFVGGIAPAQLPSVRHSSIGLKSRENRITDEKSFGDENFERAHAYKVLNETGARALPPSKPYTRSDSSSGVFPRTPSAEEKRKDDLDAERRDDDRKASATVKDVDPSTHRPRASVFTAQSYGGCILVTDSTSIEFTNIVLTGCRAQRGAGLAALNAAVRVSSSTFSHNSFASADQASSVGIGGYFFNATASVSSCLFEHNRIVTGYRASGVSLTFSISIVSVENCTFLKSKAKATYIYGGDIFVRESPVVRVTNITVIGITLEGYVEGGVAQFYICPNVTLGGTIRAQDISVVSGDNLYGGAFYVERANILMNGTFSVTDVRASVYRFYGGAYYFYQATSVIAGTHTVSRVTITTQSARSYGGGLHFESIDSATLLGTFVVSDISSVGWEVYGGGVYVYDARNVSLAGTFTFSNFSQKVTASSRRIRGGGGMHFEICDSFTADWIVKASSISLRGADVYGGAISFLNNRNISLAGAVSISAISMGAYFAGGAVYFSGATSVSITGPLSVSDITADVSTFVRSLGAGLFCDTVNSVSIAGSIEVTNVTVAGAEVAGGGLYFYNCLSIQLTGNFTVRFVSIASSALGGGMYFNSQAATVARISLNGLFVVTDVAIGTSPQKSYGGAFYFDTAIVSIVGSMTASRISAVDKCEGGGFYWYDCNGVHLDGPLTITDVTLGGPDSFGGGLYFDFVTDVTFPGPISISNILLNGSGVVGGGAYIQGSQNVSFSNFVITNSTITSTTLGAVSGAGIYVLATYNLNLMNGTFTNIRALSSIPTSFSSARYTPPPETNATQHCQPDTFISQPSGTLTDGSWGVYSNFMRCQWVINPRDNLYNAFASHLVLNITRLSMKKIFATKNCYYDYVAVYDGVTAAPGNLIASYCGLDSVTCIPGADGRCPPPTNIASKGSAVTVVFVSDRFTTGDGFSLSWSSILAPPDRSGSTGTFPDTVSFFTGGGGVAAFQSTVTVSSCTFRSISSNDTFISVGAAVLVVGGELRVSNSAFASTQVSGIIAGGGAIAALSTAIVTISSCSFEKGVASSTGFCTPGPLGNDAQCPVSLGGAVLVSSARVAITNSSFTNNTASCESAVATCTTNGGALAVTTAKLSSLSLGLNSTCTNNLVACRNSSRCVFGNGGCLSGSGGRILVEDSLIVDNMVDGIGGGGGMYFAGDSVITISGTEISRNSAREGGGMFQKGNSDTNMTKVRMVGNDGIIIAGAIASTEDARLSLTLSTIANNTAKRVTGIFGFSDKGVARYSISNCEFVQTSGVATLLVGTVSVDIVSVWNSTFPGTSVARDQNDVFFQMSFPVCEQGSYALGGASTLLPNRTCLLCPFGAKCKGGSETGDGLVAQKNFYGRPNSRQGADFLLCPTGFCCNSDDGCDLNYCAGNRVGTLCGSCRPGQGLRFFRDGCRSSETCNDARWFGVALCAVALVFIGYLLRTTGKETTATIGIMMFYYQVVSLVKSSEWTHTSAAFTIVLQSAFNFAPIGSVSDEGGWGGVCLYPEMTQAAKLATGLLFRAVVPAVFLLVFIVHHLLFWVGVPKIQDFPPTVAHYIACLIRFFAISYTALVLIPLQMLQCIPVGSSSQRVWFLDGEVLCLQYWQKWVIVFISVLVPIPLIVVLVMRKHGRPDLSLGPITEGIRHVFAAGFTEKRSYWLGVSLYRRFMLVLVYTQVINIHWRSIATTTLCVLFIILNLQFRPLADRRSHHLENVSLVCLLCLSVLSSPQMAKQAFGSVREVEHEVALEWLQLAFFVIPAIGYLAVLAVRKIEERFSPKRPAEREADAEMSELKAKPPSPDAPSPPTLNNSAGPLPLWSLASDDTRVMRQRVRDAVTVNLHTMDRQALDELFNILMASQKREAERHVIAIEDGAFVTAHLQDSFFEWEGGGAAGEASFFQERSDGI